MRDSCFIVEYKEWYFLLKNKKTIKVLTPLEFHDILSHNSGQFYQVQGYRMTESWIPVDDNNWQQILPESLETNTHKITQMSNDDSDYSVSWYASLTTQDSPQN